VNSSSFNGLRRYADVIDVHGDGQKLMVDAPWLGSCNTGRNAFGSAGNTIVVTLYSWSLTSEPDFEQRKSGRFIMKY
jgi:hypothetical protein